MKVTPVTPTQNLENPANGAGAQTKPTPSRNGITVTPVAPSGPGAAAQIQLDGKTLTLAEAQNLIATTRQELVALKESMSKNGDPAELRTKVSEYEKKFQSVEPLVNALRNDQKFFEHVMGYVRGDAQTQTQTAPQKPDDVMSGFNIDMSGVEFDEEATVADLFNPSKPEGKALLRLVGGAVAHASGKVIVPQLGAQIQGLQKSLESRVDQIAGSVRTISADQEVERFARETNTPVAEVRKALDSFSKRNLSFKDILAFENAVSGNGKGQQQQPQTQQQGTGQLSQNQADPLAHRAAPGNFATIDQFEQALNEFVGGSQLEIQ